MVGLACVHLCRQFSSDLLDLAHGGIAQSLVGLVWVLALFPSCLDPNLSSNGPALPWAYVALRNMVLRFVSLHILSVFSM